MSGCYNSLCVHILSICFYSRTKFCCVYFASVISKGDSDKHKVSYDTLKIHQFADKSDEEKRTVLVRHSSHELFPEMKIERYCLERMVARRDLLMSSRE